MVLRRVIRACVLTCVAAALAVLSACSGPTPLCDQAGMLLGQGQLAQATELYARADAQDEGGCASSGLANAGERYADAAKEAARGASLEISGDGAGAAQAYRAALAIDAGNTAAATGLARLGQGAVAQPAPLPLPEAAPTAPPPSWWSVNWPLVAGGIALVLLASAGVAWFAVRRDRSARATVDGAVRGQIEAAREEANRADEAADRRTVERLLNFQRRIRAQQAEIVQLQRVLDRSLRAAAPQTVQAPRYFAADGPGTDRTDPALGVVLEVLAVRTPARQGPDEGQRPGTNGDGSSSSREPQFRVAVRRVLDHEAPATRWSPEDAPDTAVEDRAAARRYQSDWAWVEELWVTPVRPGEGWLAVDLDGLGHGWTTLLRGLPPASADGPSLEPPGERLGEHLRAALEQAERVDGPVPSPRGCAPEVDVHLLARVCAILVGLGHGSPVLTNAQVLPGPPGVLALAAAESLEEALGRELTPVGVAEPSSVTA